MSAENVLYAKQARYIADLIEALNSLTLPEDAHDWEDCYVSKVVVANPYGVMGELRDEVGEGEYAFFADFAEHRQEEAA